MYLATVITVVVLALVGLAVFGHLGGTLPGRPRGREDHPDLPHGIGFGGRPDDAPPSMKDIGRP